MRISDWSSDVCSSDLLECVHGAKQLDVDFPNFRMPGRQCPNIGNVCENIARGYACFAMKIGIWPCPQVEGITETITLEHLLPDRSEEHTSELQSLMRISYAVFCLKKKKTKKTQYHETLM